MITDLAVLGFDDKTLRMKLLSIHPTASLKDVVENTGFDLILPQEAPVTAPPTVEEQKIIRTIADVTGEFTGWKKQGVMST